MLVPVSAAKAEATVAATSVASPATLPGIDRVNNTRYIVIYTLLCPQGVPQRWWWWWPP